MVGIILGIIGICVAIALPLTLGWLSKPKLTIHSSELPVILSVQQQLLIIGVGNRQLPSPVSKFLQRHSASCSAKLTFYQKREAQVYSAGKLVGEEESKLPVVECDALWSTKRFGLTMTRMEPGYFAAPKYEAQTNFYASVDIPAGQEVFIIMPIKERGDEYCYLCNPADLYLASKNWKNVATKLEKGEYEVAVDINCKGLERVTQKFLLRNTGSNFGAQPFSLEVLKSS